MPSKAPTTRRDAWQRGSSHSSSAPLADKPATPPRMARYAEQMAQAFAQARPVVVGCDPSPEGVLAAVGCTYLAHAHSGQVRLASRRCLQAQLGEETVLMPPAQDDDVVAFARRVLMGFARKVTKGCHKRRDDACSPTCDNACVQRLWIACASDDPSMPEVVHQYLRLGFALGPSVRTHIANSHVADFDALARHVLNECEHTRQFVRFSHMADGSFAASFTPGANTIPLTAPHFAARMSTERFFLVDPRHRVAAFHEAGQRRCQLVTLDAALAQSLATQTDVASDELYVRAMWRRFYQGTTTPGRGRSQRGYDLQASWMPKHFWDGLTELAPQDDPSLLEVPTRYAGAEPLLHG